MNIELIRQKIGADSIYEGGIFKVGDKYGIVNLESGEIIKEPFADRIYYNGAFEQGDKEGFIDTKTGEIIINAVDKRSETKIKAMTDNLFKRVSIRFLRAFVSGAIASMVAFGGAMTLSAADWSDVLNWLALLLMAGIVGGLNAGIQATDLYLRNRNKVL